MPPRPQPEATDNRIPYAFLSFLALAFIWLYLVNSNVPDPYLDEVFHVHQALLYRQGRWDRWHPKITTPAGLYLLSWTHVTFGRFLFWSGNVTVTWLRFVNFDLGALFLPFLIGKLIGTLADCYDLRKSISDEAELAKRGWPVILARHTLFNICLFPPLFFFYGLYYTDVASAVSVLMAYFFYLTKQKHRFLTAGLISLWFRQTNIFWVAVFMGGLEVIRALPGGRPTIEYPERPTFWDIVSGSWQHGCIYTPLAVTADFQEYLMSGISLLIAVPLNLHLVLPALGPHLILLAAFASFVLWNGGVVLGDKDNHVASLHLAQMLYIWPYFVFFSFPMLYPWLLNIGVPEKYLPTDLKTHAARSRLPSLKISIPVMAAMLAVVHYNTIVHPFSLADNRHYMFYVFRILLRHWTIKYLAVPIYFVGAWATITALGGPEARNLPITAPRTSVRGRHQVKHPPPSPPEERGNIVPFVLVWLLATSLSLITAPLVEPRYFIIPWIIWRLNIISPHRKAKAQMTEERRREVPHNVTWYDHRLTLETIWFLLINGWTGYMFLYRGFTWPQEPGKVQRFMW